MKMNLVTLLALVGVSAGSPCAPPKAMSTPSLPINGGPHELAPPDGLTLKHIALGVGVQNYTCSSSTPKSIGALATLYDITPLSSRADFDALPSLALGRCHGGSGCLDLPVLGRHFFNAGLDPVFELGQDTLLIAAKNASVDAPAHADPGPEGTGAVAWLRLTEKPGAGSRGAKLAYRVVTAGGNPRACNGTAESVPYAAQYWFFG